MCISLTLYLLKLSKNCFVIYYCLSLVKVYERSTVTGFAVMDQVSAVVDPLVQFTKSSVHFFHRCTKPDRKGNFVMLVF